MSAATFPDQHELGEHYPESDGTPVAETELHVDELLVLRDTLVDFFRDAPDVYVGANMFVYYEKGVPRAVFAPDVFVARGVPRRVRRTYKLWEEGGVPPSAVVEISSDSTWLEDTGNKKALCARLGVKEYFLFDPNGDYLEPRLQGFRLQGGDYERIAPDGDGAIASEVLGLRLSTEGVHLRCTDACSGQRLLRPQEARAALREGQQARRDAEQARRDAEQAQREAEQARRDAEHRAAEAERELERLRAELARRGG